ncbi:MAG: putative exonuclease of the beta-lactamase fold involved in RNA processing [Candidatus Uhrbacteria bacterium GW2011_GWF2_41_16]|uniref:Putative exonuclease of the beta-lactamase fold involved in RNA processing n=2 Tax=Candidatus Uhriibacteriota TaxID=1752732 RepID=A0A0G0YAY8_9BACT|nr:MAG: putative exonuclease of the beta-lactamase fold involved in RNA processing [Candidatus Uhrbacteria bacterium GW2011_GWC2_41_11]KKR97477.1 MAG: putative exonuclease of the beta-lactamase fold involved in RNA processing [Candidatus Uhrbacteria bacterium GW2011_GWF2_41_16]
MKVIQHFERMKIAFHGAAREVTGSCILLTVHDTDNAQHRLLIDCGMFQGERFADERNAEPFVFDVETIDAVFVTHPHADHTGRLPSLLHQGYRGPITMTHPCLSLTRLVLEDAYHIMEENARRSQEPLLYQKEDVESVVNHCTSVNYHESITVAPGVTVMFHDAGHVLGSAFISVEAEGKRIVFSGDIGNDDVPILADTESISTADIVVCESTYGDRVHEGKGERSERLKEYLVGTIREKGVLMIPSFSIERTQELLYELNQILLHELKTDVPIFLDSPMAIKATEVYRHFKEYLQFDESILSDPDRDFFSFPNLRETLTVDESKTINDIPAPKIIIAGSGMMSGGRIMHHLLRYLGDRNSMVLIIGYQGHGTLGRKLYEGANEVFIYGQRISVRAQIKAIGAFSAHGDMNKLTRWLHPEDGKIPQKIFLVHGDLEAKEIFAAHLREELHTEIVIPEVYSVHEV